MTKRIIPEGARKVTRGEAHSFAAGLGWRYAVGAGAEKACGMCSYAKRFGGSVEEWKVQKRDGLVEIVYSCQAHGLIREGRADIKARDDVRAEKAKTAEWERRTDYMDRLKARFLRWCVPGNPAVPAYLFKFMERSVNRMMPSEHEALSSLFTAMVNDIPEAERVLLALTMHDEGDAK